MASSGWLMRSVSKLGGQGMNHLPRSIQQNDFGLFADVGIVFDDKYVAHG